MKISQGNVGILVLGMVWGAILTVAGMMLWKQTQPAPILIMPPEPTATAIPTPTPGPMRVFVNGAVAAAGVYTLPAGSLVEQAIVAAGGFSEDANTAVINLAQPLSEGSQVYVPTLTELAATPTAVIGGPAGKGTAVDVDPAVSGDLIDINEAGIAELDSLPGIGPSTAEKIIEYRNNNGLFQTIEEIMNVPGIGEAKFGQIKDLITVRGN